jgi:hypothetical protein
MEHKSYTAFDRSTDIGPQIMEHRPNSNPENSAVIRAESPILSLTERYILTRVTNLWDGSKYVTYRTKEARVRSFIIRDWTHVLDPAPNALSDACFFFTGRIHIIF